MKPERFLLQIPVASFTYINQAFALRRALMRQQIDCHIQVQGLSADAERALLCNYRPQVVLAINGQRSEVSQAFSNIRYLHWIQDNNFNGQDLRQAYREAGSGDIYYLVDGRQMQVMQFSPECQTGRLRFAAEPEAADMPRPPERSRFSLVGYIPPATLLNASFTLAPGNTFTGMDYFEFLESVLQDSLDFPLELIDQITEAFFNTRNATTQGVEHSKLTLFKEEYIRASNRYRMVKKILSLGYDCRLYGPIEWRSWAELASSYRGEAPTIDQTREIFQTSAINLHNGGIINHPRVFDCMGAHGGLVLANRFGQTDAESEFEPGIHYVEADLSDMEEVTRHYLENREAARKISDAAYELICARHTWDHRVAEILADLDA
jgi:hypothetical protein